MTDKQSVGQKGENLACAFLKKRGFKITERNFRRAWGEIDIIAQKDGGLRFVEVKTVSPARDSEGEDDYRPEENIHPWKMKRLRRIIETYLLGPGKRFGEWQVDVIVVYLGSEEGEPEIDWLEDVVI